jgi:hypothetical protein
VYLVDRKYVLLGGMNLGREYRYEWHNAMVELEGPLAVPGKDGVGLGDFC